MTTRTTTGPPLYVSNPEKWLEEVNKNDFVCIIFFRGSWCKFDEYYLKHLGEFNKKEMQKEKVHLIAWTSEGAEGAKKADEQWHLTKEYGYAQVIGDETCALANYLKEDEILPNLITSTPEEAHATEHITSSSTYPNGIVQPGMVFYAHKGNLTCHWEAKVEPPSYGGAERPEPAEIWVQVMKRKHALDHGNAIMPVHADLCKTCTHMSDVEKDGCQLL